MKLWREAGPELVLAHPITYVELPEFEPSDESWGVSRWYSARALAPAPDVLPADLFALLRGSAAGGNDFGRSVWRDYASYEGAVGALSAAALALVRPGPT